MPHAHCSQRLRDQGRPLGSTLVVMLTALLVSGCGEGAAPTAPGVVPSSASPPEATSAANLGGRYTVTFSAADACGELPPDVRVRSYSATITDGAGPGFVGELSGADFQPGYDTFSGVRRDRGVEFFFMSVMAQNTWMDDLPIIERLSQTESLEIIGWTAAVRLPTPDELSTTFAGAFSYCAATVEPENAIWPMTCEAGERVGCWSERHRMTLSRQ